MSVPTRGRRNPTDLTSLAGKPWNLVAGPVERAIRGLMALYDSIPSQHEETHLQGGSDALQAPGTPTNVQLNVASDAGVGPSYALEDHIHGLSLGLTAKGDLVIFTGTAYSVLAVGANRQVPTADSSSAGGFKWAFPLSSVVTPAQLVANANDYALASGDTNRMSTDASHDLTGMVAGTNGERRVLVNVGAFDLVIKHQNAGSAAANRFLSDTGADLTMTPSKALDIWYDSVTARWRVYLR